MSDKILILLVIIAVCITTSCCPALPSPTLEPTATLTPTPIIIIVTATPVPTPTVSLHNLLFVPDEVERFAAQLVPLHGVDFAYALRLGITQDTIIYLKYEAPIGSGQFYIARYGIVDNEWSLLDTMTIESVATPMPSQLAPQGEARR